MDPAPLRLALEAAFAADDPAPPSRAREAQRLAAVERLIAALAGQDFAAVKAELDPGVSIEIHAPPEFPFERRISGSERLVETLTANFAAVEQQGVEILGLVAQGDAVVLTFREQGRLRETGAPYDVHTVMEFRFAGDRVRHIREMIAPSTGMA